MPCALNSDVLKSQLFQHNQQLLWDDAAFHPEHEIHVTQEDAHRHATRAFAAVADVFERAYDKTVDDLNRYMGGDQHFLARAKPHQKRLRPRKPTLVQSKVSPARARQGDYEPPCEVYNVKHLQLVKQIRRIQALLRRLKKTQNTPVADHVNRQNWQEWFAITSNRAFKPNFAAWCLRGHIIMTWYHDLPTAPWLQSLFDALQVVVNDMIRTTNDNRRKHFTFRVQVDLLHFGGSIASAVVKEKRNSKPVAFEVDHHVDAQLLRKQGKGAPLISLPKVSPINLAQPFSVHGKHVTLKPTTDECIFAAPGLPGDATIQFLQALKLSLDPHKSWCWGTTPQARKAWHSINLEVVGSPKYFAITTTERVLGVCMHFARKLNHGCLSTRLDAGIARLERLAKLNLPLDQAARLIQSTIWPMTLFGTDVVYVGKKHFSKLRSLASAVLVKKTAVTSTYLALTTLTSRTVDPFVYTVSRAICLWRRLFMLDPCNRGLYVQTLATATDNPCKAFGPAGALKSYLLVLGWSVNDDASITDHAQRTFFLENVTPAFIVGTIRDAWDAHISQHVRSRVDFDGWPEIDHVLTCRVPLPKDARHRAVVAKLRTLGSLYATQREHWEGHEEWITGECPLCQSADTRDHFPYKCQQVNPLRQEFERTLQRATLDFPHLCFLPVVHKHPKQSITAYLHHKRELPDVFNLEDYHLPVSYTPVFFTDGSAAFPKLGGQIAAWSIVLDLAINDLQRTTIVNGIEDLRQTPSTLVPVQISLVAGSQTINRAELQAIYQIVRSVNSAIIYTDSAWAIERFLEVRQCPNPERFWNQHHSDILILLCELAQTKNLSNFTLCKIKSHQNIAHLTDPVGRYLALGNRFADELAKHATEKHHSPMHRLCWEIATWYAEQLEVLVALQPFLAKAEILRLDAMQKQTPNLDFAVKEHFSVEHAIMWQPANLQPPLVFEIPERLLSAFQPSPGALKQLVQWALTLQWPSEDNISGGISWYELLINFLLITQCKIPVQTERKKQHPIFRDFAIHEDAILFPQSVWDCVRFLETGFHYIKRFTGVSLAPLQMHKTRWFLSAYGYQKRISGVSVRPVLPCQLDHIRLLKSAISENELHLPDLSGFPCWFPRQILSQDHLSHRDRYLNHRALAYYVRRHGVLS
eukprot:Skav205446  [mRNA]  locus=scaffold2907:4322:8729:- [translate_table: standard]